MKILIAADMEGITGVVNWDQVNPNHAEYSRFRRLMTADVNAAIAGALAGGADEVTVTDGHNNGSNILIEELDGRARLNSGSPSGLSMVEGVQSADAVIFVGYHARAGALHAVLCHTWTDVITNVWLNGRPCGEIGLNASVAGSFGAPVLMIAGDLAACDEAAEWVQGICPVVVKRAHSRYAAECLPPAQTQALIRQNAEDAVRKFAAGKGPAPLATAAPLTGRVEFANAVQADNAGKAPGARRVDGRTVEISAGDMPGLYAAFRTLASLGRG